MLSVIIPTLNEQDFLPKLVSFLKSHGGNSEIIIVDGGSTDNTVEIVQQAGFSVITTELCSRAAQMNRGALAASADILFFLHADVTPPSSFLKDIQEAIDKGYSSGCYRFKYDRYPHALMRINAYFTRFPYLWCRGGDQTLFIKNDLFKDLEGFNERFVIMEDYDIIERIKKNESFTVLKKSVTVSSRKYLKNSYLKVQLANFNAMKMYRKGMDPNKIKAYYERNLKK